MDSLQPETVRERAGGRSAVGCCRGLADGTPDRLREGAGTGGYG